MNHEISRTWSAAVLCAAIGCGGGDDLGRDRAPHTDASDVSPSDVAQSDASLPERDANAHDADTGNDKGTDADAPESEQFLESPCDLSRITPSDRVALPHLATIGPFTLRLDTDGGVRLTGEGAAPIAPFETPRGAPLPRFGRQELEATEKQGSFSIEENVGALCDELAVEEAWAVDGAAVVRGALGGSSCEGAHFEVHWCEVDEPGQVRFHVTSDDPSLNFIEFVAAADANERVFGMGEQFPHDTLNLRGRAIPVLSQEGGVGRGRQPISAAVDLVSPGSAGSEDSTYYAAPYFLTDRGRALFLEGTEYASFDFRAEDRFSIQLFSHSMTGRVVQGSNPLEIIERFTAWAGRMTEPPAWVHEGAIVALARDLPESERIVDELVDAGAAISAIWNQTWSGTAETFIGEQVLWNWTQNPARHPGWETFVSNLKARGMRALCYINPMLRELPEGTVVPRHLWAEAEAAGYFVKNERGEIYELEVTAFDVGLIDLTNLAARTWIKEVIRVELIEKAECAGWMVDFGEALPFDAVLHDGTSAAAYHNRYPVEWMRVNREVIEEAGLLSEVLTFNRSGSARTPRYAQLLWTGDQLTTWDPQDGMVSALRGLIGSGLSGIALNHTDIGGYTSLSRFGLGYSREETLLKRWTEWAAFTAVMRTHEGNQPGANAQIYDDAEARSHFARMTKIYRALAPYRASLFAQAAARGWPVVRHMMLHAGGDPEAYEVDDQFMLGADVVVAPTLRRCFNPIRCRFPRSVYLPAGAEWVHLWSGAVTDARAGAERIEIGAPYGEPAVFYRRSAPMASELRARLRAEGIEVPAP